jgi:alpha-tubulin suppressor-like RCC1 family protein
MKVARHTRFCSFASILLSILTLAAATPPATAAQATDPGASSASIHATAIASAVAVGMHHTCALTSTGGVKCWGYNAFGQLGDGTTTDRHTPTDVSGLGSGVAALAAGAFHTCAVTNGGGVKCWGANGEGQLGDGTTTRRYTPVAVSGLASGVTAISAGLGHTCALTAGGGVKCWGENHAGELGDGTTTDRHTPVAVSGLSSGVWSIAAGNDHTCALTYSDGAKCWGWNHFGQLGDGSSGNVRLTPVAVSGLGSGVRAVAAGASSSCALTSSGGAKCWGNNKFGQLGDGTTTDRHTPVAVSGLGSGVVAIVIGGWRTCAVTGSGGAQCWGQNQHGQVGDGTTTTRHTPVAVSGLGSGFPVIAAHWYHACALTSGGGLKCWGHNRNGQLGDATTTDRHTPVDVDRFGGTYTIDVTISLHGEPSASERTLYENTMRYFADAIYEASNGAHKVRHVTFYQKGTYVGKADIIWEAGGIGTSCWPMAHVNGYGKQGWTVQFCDVNMQGEDYIANDVAQQNGGYTLAHELGHYYYGVFDEYRGTITSSTNIWDPVSTDMPVSNSIMHQQRNAISGTTNIGRTYHGDFSWLNFSTNLNNHTNTNAQYRCYAASVWETLARSPADDPRDGKRSRLPRRRDSPELANAAPSAGSAPSIELPAGRGQARGQIQFHWYYYVAALPSNGLDAYRALIGSLDGDLVTGDEPIVVYAAAAKGAALISGAAAVGVATDPIGRRLDLQFVDNGTTPDTQANDGMYYALLEPVDGDYLPGVYSVTVTIDNQGGGASFTYQSYAWAADVDGYQVTIPDTPVTDSFEQSASVEISVQARTYLPVVLRQ